MAVSRTASATNLGPHDPTVENADAVSQRNLHRALSRPESCLSTGKNAAENPGRFIIHKASPQQNWSIERYNRSMRGGILNEEMFRTLTEARVVNNVWLDQYNNLWPRCGLGMRAPAALAAEAIAELKEGEREGVALETNETQTGPKPGRQPPARNHRKPR